MTSFLPHIMTADERLILIRRKIERADKHIKDLEAAIHSFFAANPYKILPQRDPQTRKLFYYIAHANPIPDELGAICGDILNNLRSSLDHLAQQLYLVGSGSTLSYRDQTSFPIGNRAKDFKSLFRAKVEGMRQDAINAIRALEPYKGGNGDDLWTFHRLNNIDKHRLIVTVGASYRSMDFSFMAKRAFGQDIGAMFPPLLLRPANKLFPLKAGDVLFMDAVDAEPDENIKFNFEIVIHEPGVIEGKSLFETMIQFRDRVSNIVDGFKPCLV